jgi:cyclase
MSKPRLIGCLVMRDGWIVQSIGFHRYLPVGRPHVCARFLDRWGIDEILLLDIKAAREGRLVDPDIVARVADGIFAPLTVGGGIASTADIRLLLRSGADKICLNRAAATVSGLIAEAAAQFGAQCVIAAVDARRVAHAGHTATIDGGSRDLAIAPEDLAARFEREGAGEILLTSIDRDGSGAGYDLDLCRKVAERVHCPVIAVGGAGGPAHVAEVLAIDGIEAAAVGNLLHFTEHSVAVLKAALASREVAIRVDAPADYRGRAMLANGRLARQADAVLEAQIFERTRDEAI